MKLEVKNWDNEVVGDVELPDEVFAREVGEHLVWEVVPTSPAGDVEPTRPRSAERSPAPE